MAEINTPAATSRKKSGVKKLQKHTIRVDLTPMVDLGFLLITFFVFTTSLAEAKVMDLNLPNDSDTTITMPVKQSGTLTVILYSTNKLFYYEGILEADGGNIKQCREKELRHIIINKKRTTNADDLFLVLKATSSSAYEDVVNLLDEMVISDIKRYGFVELSAEEEKVLAGFKQ